MNEFENWGLKMVVGAENWWWLVVVQLCGGGVGINGGCWQWGW